MFGVRGTGEHRHHRLGFGRNGYVAVRSAFDAATAATCGETI
jgi:hypothetical protein